MGVAAPAAPQRSQIAPRDVIVRPQQPHAALPLPRAQPRRRGTPSCASAPRVAGAYCSRLLPWPAAASNPALPLRSPTTGARVRRQRPGKTVYLSAVQHRAKTRTLVRCTRVPAPPALATSCASPDATLAPVSTPRRRRSFVPPNRFACCFCAGVHHAAAQPSRLSALLRFRRTAPAGAYTLDALALKAPHTASCITPRPRGAAPSTPPWCWSPCPARRAVSVAARSHACSVTHRLEHAAAGVVAGQRVVAADGLASHGEQRLRLRRPCGRKLKQRGVVLGRVRRVGEDGAVGVDVAVEAAAGGAAGERRQLCSSGRCTKERRTA